MDSFDMPAPGADRLRFRWKRMNPSTVDPGSFFVVMARQMEAYRVIQFPAILEWSLDGIVWKDVEVTNDFADNPVG